MVDYRINEFQLLLHRAVELPYDLLDMMRVELCQFLFHLRFIFWRIGENHKNLHCYPSFS